MTIVELADLVEEITGDSIHDFPKLVAEVQNADFSTRSKCHDWKNHVPLEMRKNWSKLSNETKLCVYAMAEESASAEEWD